MNSCIDSVESNDVEKTAGGKVAEVVTVIAIVEDDLSVRRALARLLKSVGFRVLEYASGEAFLEGEQNGNPDCLLIDLHLGGLNGVEVLEEMGRRGSEVPAVLMTARDSNETKSVLSRVPHLDCLRKPFTEESLLDSIKKLL